MNLLLPFLPSDASTVTRCASLFISPKSSFIMASLSKIASDKTTAEAPAFMYFPTDPTEILLEFNNPEGQIVLSRFCMMFSFVMMM